MVYRGEPERFVDQTPFKEEVKTRLDANLRNAKFKPSESPYDGDKHIAEFDATLTRFSQNSKGDYQVLLSVPYRYKKAVLALSEAHGILLHTTIDKWTNESGS